MSLPFLPRVKFVPLAVAALLGGMSAMSFAAPVVYGNITLDAQYALNGGATVDGMGTASINSTSNGADLYLSAYDAGSSVFFHTYGFTGSSTYFGARASGSGIFSAMTSTTYSQTFTNTSGTAQAFNFGFNVDSGGLSIYGNGNALADLLLRVKVNGTDVARDHTTITQTGSSVTCTTDDLGSLGLYSGCSTPNSSYENGNGGPYNVSLGIFGAGESFTLDYDIIATVSGTELAGSGNCYGGYGGNIESCFSNLSAMARSGDPFNIPVGAGDPTADFSITSSSTVPEPGSLALMGLALAGLATTRRKKAVAS